MKHRYIILIPLIALTVLHGYKHYSATQESTNNTPLTDERNNPMELHSTQSGLQYTILKEGDGQSPKAGQKISVHYTGWLDNNGQPGTKFDSSVDRGTPFNFNVGVGQVIKGWDEGVMMMRVGEKRRLIIPAALGYGSRGAGNIIPGNATLIFDVELISMG